MKDAQVAILDEPTSGLDPQVTIELLDIIRALKQRGVSVLLSSHLLARVQSVCDRVALFNEGKIVLMGTVPDLGRQVLGGGFRVEVEAEGGASKRSLRDTGRRAGRERGAESSSAARRPRRASRGRGCRGRGGRPPHPARSGGAEPRSDLSAVLPGAPTRRRAPCGVKVPL